jgi:hypothetical protein
MVISVTPPPARRIREFQINIMDLAMQAKLGSKQRLLAYFQHKKPELPPAFM